MSENGEYRSGQGTIIPRLFIGLGGVGSRIVDRIAGRTAYLPNWESQLRPLTNFISIDTNELDQHKLKHVPDGNRLNIAAFDKAKAIEYLRRSKDPQALQWLDRGYQPRPVSSLAPARSGWKRASAFSITPWRSASASRS